MRPRSLLPAQLLGIGRLAIVAAAVALPPPALAAAEPEVSVAIRDHRFEPGEVRVPAGQKVKLIVDNQDPTAEEFESKALKREKVIPPRTKATIIIGPLKPGRYEFLGEFNEATAKGVVIAE